MGIVESAVAQLMDQDAKTTGLKQLQGLVWKQGFRSGELARAPVSRRRALPASCVESGASTSRIYSSGSVAAQRLFFEHSDDGDLLPWLSGHYDTTIGSKTDPESYRAIAREFSCDAAEITFVSDNLRELDAAREAGLATVMCPRPGNPPTPDHDHPVYAELVGAACGLIPGLAEAAGHLIPVDDVEEGRDVIGTPILVVEVIGVLPDIDTQDRDPTLHQWRILVRRTFDNELSVVQRQPCPSAAKTRRRGIREGLFETCRTRPDRPESPRQDRPVACHLRWDS